MGTPVTVLIQPINQFCTPYMPKFAHKGDAGMDLCSRIDVVVGCGETIVVPTGIRVALPEGFEMQIRSRSGLAAKRGVFVLNSPGTVDCGYRDEIRVIVHNTGHEIFTIGAGDRIAQAVICELPAVTIQKVSPDDSLPTSERGLQGFGSTGVK